MTGSYADRLNVMRRYWNFFYALFCLTKLGFGHMMCAVHIDMLCHRWVDDNLPRLWLGQIPVDANVIDKQPKSASRQQTPLSALACEQTQQQATGLFTPFIKTEQLFLLEGFTSPTVPDKNKCLRFYLPPQRLKNFALISVSDRDFTRVTRGDQQWFGEQSPSPILHKEPNTVCLGSGPSLDRGAAMSIV